MLKAERISCSGPKLSDAQTRNFEAIKHTLSAARPPGRPMPRSTRPRRGRSRERPSIPPLPAGARSSRMQRAYRRRWERRSTSAIPTIHGSGAPTRTPMAFSGTGSRRARASTMSATARCGRHAIHSTGDHASVSSGSAPGRSTTTSRCTCSEDSPQNIGNKREFISL